MARTYDGIDERLAAWIVEQPVFFVATAPLAGDGHVNCSPKGNRGELRVLDAHTVAYADQTGSGIETVAHLRENGRIVLMLCAFAGPPRIVRLHGTGRVVVRGSDEFEDLAAGWPPTSGIGVRSVIVVDVTRVADSCGYGVPFMTFDRHRPTMDEWAARKGAEGLKEYQEANNGRSVDGLAGLPQPAVAGRPSSATGTCSAGSSTRSSSPRSGPKPSSARCDPASTTCARRTGDTRSTCSSSSPPAT